MSCSYGLAFQCHSVNRISHGEGQNCEEPSLSSAAAFSN